MKRWNVMKIKIMQANDHDEKEERQKSAYKPADSQGHVMQSLENH